MFFLLAGIIALFTITVESTFSAEHQLTLAGGSGEAVHSHEWIVRAAVSAAKLDENGLVVDFSQLKEKVAKIVAPLDGTRLEDVPSFQGLNTSAENVAKYIFMKLEPALARNVKLKYVEICEEAGCWAKYCR